MTRAIPSFWVDELEEMIRGVFTDPRSTDRDFGQLWVEISTIASSMKDEAVRAGQLPEYQALLNAMGMLDDTFMHYLRRRRDEMLDDLEGLASYHRFLGSAMVRLVSYNCYSPMDTFHDDVFPPSTGWKPTGTTVDALSDISLRDMQRMFPRRGTGYPFVGPHGNWLVEADPEKSMRILAIVNPESQWTAMPLVDWLLIRRKGLLGT